MTGQAPAAPGGGEVRPGPQPGSLLHFVTCGSVDDGKSTLIGRLLFDAGLVPQDHLAALERDSRGRPCGPEGLDLSLLVDGLSAEREQGITIDVAYRYFATPRRSFIVADAPGHEQYTRNMATAASSAQAALVLVDARKGILTQTRRHGVILALMGVEQVAVVVNKMDLVAYDEATFREIAEEFERVARNLGIAGVTCIPVSAREGANVVRRANETPWYAGPSLLEWLETITVGSSPAQPFRMPIQWVNRTEPDFRGLSGAIVSGEIGAGDRVASSRSARESAIARIVTFDRDLSSAAAGQAVTLVLQDDLDLGRGDVLFRPEAPPTLADQFAAHLIWLGDEPMVPHRSYLMRIGARHISAEVTWLKHRLNIDNGDKISATVLDTNDIGFCNIAVAEPIPFDPYRKNREMGGFILIDRATQWTVGMGTIEFVLQRSENLRWQDFDVTREQRAVLKGQQPAILWFTGLPGAGKSTVANLVDRRLMAKGLHTYVLDGDNIRHGLSKDLGFTEAARVENIRRVAEVARLMADAGLIVLVSLISPFRHDRQMAREIAADVDFLEIFVDASLQTCERRDPKGLYARARAGQIRNFTGISSPYQPPVNPDIRLQTDVDEPDACAERLLAELAKRGLW